MKRIKINKEKCDVRYANWLSILIDLMKPMNLYLYGGRGLAKSTDILAKRFIDVVYDMPGAPLAFVADTYVNLMTNILPHVKIGFDRFKFIENYHFVVGTRPPDSWLKPSVRHYDFKHVLSTFNGCTVFLKSLDRPSINAGISVVHQFGDEAKYFQEAKLSKFFPTLRGDLIRFGGSHYFMGQTFCSDMPDPNVAVEHDWMDKMAEKMDKKTIITILQTARVINEINIEIWQAQQENDGKKVQQLTIQKERWEQRILDLRRNSTFFYIASSFVNADILTMQYFENLLSNDAEKFDDFKLHILSIKRSLDAGARFYGSLDAKHFYTDGYDYEYYDSTGNLTNVTQTSKGLKYIRHDQPLEAGFDGGNMMSLVFGQEQSNTYRILKNIYTLAPESIRELANKFIEFFEPHKKKYLLLYHDRATNQYEKIKRDMASQLKHDIEFGPGEVRTGWIVQLMSKGQGNILHPDKYNLLEVMMNEKDKRIPRLLIDQWECKELKSQMDKTPIKLGPKNEILKDKKSDRLPQLSRLPFESTNLTDAFDYLICRKKWLDFARQKKTVIFSSLDIK